MQLESAFVQVELYATSPEERYYVHQISRGTAAAG